MSDDQNRESISNAMNQYFRALASGDTAGMPLMRDFFRFEGAEISYIRPYFDTRLLTGE